jgi:hypothetical protein
MKTYKIYQENIAYFKSFASEYEARAWAFDMLGPEWIVELSSEQKPAATADFLLKSDITYGKTLIDDFLLDNRSYSIPFDAQLQQVKKFQDLKTLLEVGAINASWELLKLMITDEYFTEERKQKYLSSIENYLFVIRPEL